MLVQFGNNWIKKIPLTAKLAVLGIFFIELFPNWTACSPITYTNTCEFEQDLNPKKILTCTVITCNVSFN